MADSEEQTEEPVQIEDPPRENSELSMPPQEICEPSIPSREKTDIWLHGMKICAIDAHDGLSGSIIEPPTPVGVDNRKLTHRGEVCVLEAKVGDTVSLGTAVLVITDVEPERVRWLLTAAHCVTYIENGELKFVPEMRIRVPSWKPAVKGQTMPIYEPGAEAAWDDKRFKDYYINQDSVWLYPPYFKHLSPFKGTDIALLKLPEISEKEKEQVPRLVIWDRRKQPGRLDGLGYSPYFGWQYKQITDKTPVNDGYVPRPVLHKSMKKLLRLVMKDKTEEQLKNYLKKKHVPEEKYREKIDAVHEHIKGLKAFKEAGGDSQPRNIYFQNVGSGNWVIRFKKLTTKCMSGAPLYLDCMMGGIQIGQDEEGTEVATALTIPILEWIHQMQIENGAEGRLFQPGAWVKIVGLQKKPELNGKKGTVVGQGTQPDRLSIMCGHTTAYSIRRRNLEPAENPLYAAMRDPSFREWQQKVMAYNSPGPESDDSDTPELELYDKYSKEPIDYETKRERIRREVEKRKKSLQQTSV